MATYDSKTFDELVQTIESLSQEYWCAGWRFGIEFFLWDRVVGNELMVGNLPISEEEASQLRRLSQAVEGWAIFPDVGGIQYVSMDKWNELYRRYRAGEFYDDILNGAR